MERDEFLFDKKWVIYQKIQKLKNENINISNIAEILKISRDTVYKYKDMTEEECIKYIKGTKRRKSIFDIYKKEIDLELKKNGYKNKAKVYKYIEEKYRINSSYRNFLEYIKK